MTGFLCNCVRCNVNEEKWRQQQQKPQCMYLRPEWQVSVSSNMRRCLLIVFLSLEKCDRRLGTQESTNYVCSLDKHMCVCVHVNGYLASAKNLSNIDELLFANEQFARGFILISTHRRCYQHHQTSFQSSKTLKSDNWDEKSLPNSPKSDVIRFSQNECAFERICELLKSPRHFMRKRYNPWTALRLKYIFG